MKALNRAFDKAFLHSEDDDNISELLACMGEELGCERISIFEENEEGTCDNTYEWCSPGVIREQILMQHVAIARFDSWHDRLINHETIVVRSQEELVDHDPDVYAMFVEQNIHRAIVTLLAFHGKNFGFCILEDPSDQAMYDKNLIMPGIRYILSSMIYSRNLAARLRKLGYIDTLTGAGNRVSLQEHLETMDYSRPVGIISIDMIGWDNNEGKMAHLEREQTLVRAGEILINLFDSDQVFRVATGEFIVVFGGGEEAVFVNDLHTIRALFRKHNLLASITGEWQEVIQDPIDHFIHRVHQKTEDQKKVILAHRNKEERRLRAEEDSEDLFEKADIDLPRGDGFFRIADRFLAELYEGAVVAIVTDINYFKLYNDIFGRKAGNIFLENIAGILKKTADDHGGLCGYIGGDNFCLIVPTDKKEARDVMPDVESIYNTLDFPDGFTPAMGVYFSEDRRETMITLYDKALTALAEIKGDYIRHIHIYSAEIHRHQKEDKLLLMQVRDGLAKGEFVFYVQPQVNDRTGKIIGGEALVRWIHDGNVVAPGRFIPILEKTGYVYAVDTYVWESVIRWQRDLIDRGVEPVPVSVNVSRVDFYFGDIADCLIGLLKKYDVDPYLLSVEITESAFTDNMDIIMEAVNKLHDAGIHIMMDDFGSGSSSLSMLHTMNLDVIKTDVNFMSRSSRDNRALSIVESVISMAHMIGMSVVTEGVETEEQRASLIAMGDNYVQGFYFYKPMPKEEFEDLIRNRDNVTEGYKKKKERATSQLNFKEMIREGLVSDTLLDNIIRATAIYKEEAGQISIVQLNDLYTSVTGIRPVEEEMNRFTDHLDQEAYEKLMSLFEQANAHALGGSEGNIHFSRDDGSAVELNMRVFLLYSYEDHRLYLSTMG